MNSDEIRKQIAERQAAMAEVKARLAELPRLLTDAEATKERAAFAKEFQSMRLEAEMLKVELVELQRRLLEAQLAEALQRLEEAQKRCQDYTEEMRQFRAKRDELERKIRCIHSPRSKGESIRDRARETAQLRAALELLKVDALVTEGKLEAAIAELRRAKGEVGRLRAALGAEG